MILIMSLRGAFAATKQSPVTRGDCFAIARNDMEMAALREFPSATGEELDALLPSVLDRAFKGEL